MREARNTAPFWVAGLQQFCRDGGLVLYVCAVSPEESQPLYIRHRAVKKAFGVSPGFYWQTLETRDQICQRAEAVISQQSHTELPQSSGLDVCSLQFIYLSEELLANTAVHVTGGHGWESTHQPMLTLAISGTYASSIWQETTGPSDP
ncbi:hypothetical protein SRHO_G00318040 [Serrasalmus rhombeus]